MNSEFFAKHPIPDEQLVGIHTYQRLNMNGSIAEQWELINGEWTDVTERAKAEEALVHAQEQLEKEREQERRMGIAIKRANSGQVPSHVSCPVCGSHSIQYNTDMRTLHYVFICDECRKRFNGPDLKEVD